MKLVIVKGKQVSQREQQKLQKGAFDLFSTQTLGPLHGMHIHLPDYLLAATPNTITTRECRKRDMKTDSSLSEMEMDPGMKPTSRNQNNANRRRFNDEQIKYLEFMFEAQSRPASQIKQQLANEFQLQPRQVSIRFQNRRARMKTKQVEREYNKLKTSHDALASGLESLKQENQSLLMELKKLKKIQEMQHESRNCGSYQTESSSDQRIDSRVANPEPKEQPSHILVGYTRKEDIVSCNHNSVNAESRREETETFNLYEYRDGSMTSSDWNRFDTQILMGPVVVHNGGNSCLDQ